jgi:cysteinyl-tRNA synthetase
VRRLGIFAARLESETGGTPELAAAAATLEAEVRAALYDDLNAPEALGALHGFVSRANAELDRRGGDVAALEAARRAFALVDGVLDVLPDARGLDDDLAAWAEEQLALRAAARGRRDFAAADAIRQAMLSRGITIEDTAGGTRWRVDGPAE